MVTSKKTDGRIWKACMSCRRKKIKCDGEDPCHGCQSRGQPCSFPDSNDNASTSRRYAASFEERCQHMDELCERLEGLAMVMSNCIERAQRDHQPSQESGSDCRNLDGTDQPVITTNAVVEKVVDTGELPSKSPGLDPGLLSESPGSLQSSESREYQTPSHLVGHMIKDSYGCFRYIGGATNNMMIEAAESLSPGAATCNLDSPDDEDHVRLPFFIHGQVWPEIPYLPQAKDLGRPPQYVSDLLIGIYFDQLHYTFPILYKPDFMRKYKQMTIDKRNAEADHRFLSVFLAVCACASSLLPRSSGSSYLPGIEYYQKALLLQFASTGEAFIEQVQCLGLLSLCSAGWNTLSQSWKLAGQAVRVAQDLGLHVSNLKWHPTEMQDLAGYIEAQTARCVWWSVFGLDCLISLCLGRPMSTNEYDCCCDLPVDLSNEDLERFGVPAPGDPASSATTAVTSSPLTGFLAFTRLCKIATRVHRMHSSNRTRGNDVPAHDWTHLQPTVDILIRELDEWLQALPNDIRFSANVAQNGPNLTMCVIVFILHSATIMNLYRPLARNSLREQPPGLSLAKDPASECVSAAQSCIQAAELIRERVPPSHYLAFCVQYLSISGILLLSMTEESKALYILPDVENALRFLGDLETIWPGASRSRLILDRLLRDPRRTAARDDFIAHFPHLPELDGLLWEQFPYSELDPNIF